MAYTSERPIFRFTFLIDAVVLLLIKYKQLKVELINLLASIKIFFNDHLHIAIINDAAVLLLAKYKQLSNPSRSEKIGEKMLRLMLQSSLCYKKLFKTQNLRLINKSGLKSRAAYDGVHTISMYNLCLPRNFFSSYFKGA